MADSTYVRDRDAHGVAPRNTTSNVIAGIASAFVPGLGQLVQGRLMSAAVFFLTVTIGGWFWFLIVPGIIAVVAYVWSIFDAATYRG